MDQARRDLVRRAGAGAALAWSTPLLLSATASAQVSGGTTTTTDPPPPPEPLLLGVHPWAAAQPTAWGRRLQDLVIFDGIVFCGYGDWATNTGPIRASGWSIAGGDFVSEASLDSECIWLFRRIGDRLVVPFIDNRAAIGDVAWRSLGAATWTTRPVARFAGTIHCFDAATFDGTDLWVCGAKAGTNNGAVWRSPSGVGGDWVESDIVTPLSTGGFVRITMLVRYGGRLYAGGYEFGGSSGTFTRTARAFDGTSWSDAPEFSLEVPAGVHRQGHEPQLFDGGVVRRSRWVEPLDDRPVYDFDGTTLTDTGIVATQLHVDAGGRMWWVASDLVVRRLDPGSTTPTVVCTAPPGTSCLVAEGSSLYLGTAASELWYVAV